MAVSKTQNERPAIIDLIDLANALETTSTIHAQRIATLTEGLADEISDREAADEGLEQAIGAEALARASAIQTEATARAEAIQAEATTRTEAVQNLQGQLGDGFAETSVTQSLAATNAQVLDLAEDVGTIEQTDIPPLQTFVNRFRLGVTESITIQPAGSYSGSLTYQTAFGADDLSFVVLGFAGALTLAGLEVNLIDYSYSGFSYSVSNTGSDAVTVRIGFLAVKVN